MNEHYETELVKQAQRGDRESYGRLVDHHSGSVLAITYSRVGDFAASQDIAQDAFLLGFEKLASLRRPHLFGPWLRTIATNLCHRWHRKRAYRDRLQEDRAALCERLGYDDAAKPDEAVEQDERSTILHKALEHLGMNEREALLLYYFEGKSVKQAAAAAGVSGAAMRKRLQRARDRLRNVLSAEVEAELNEAADRRKMSAYVLAAIPFGATFGKLAPWTSVAPSTTGLGAKALVAKAAGASFGTKALIGAVVGAMAICAVLAAHHFGTARTAPATPESEILPAAAGTIASPSAPPEGSSEASAAVLSPASKTSISGTITTAENTPLAGAQVEVILHDPSGDTLSMAREVAGTAETNSDGSYSIAGLPETEEKLLVFVRHPDWAVGGGRIDPLKVGEQRKDVNYSLCRPVSLSGRVVDESGQPLADTAVHLMRALPQDSSGGAAGLRGNRYGGVAHVVTDPDGAFTLANLPEDWNLTWLLAVKPGYAPAYGYSQESIERAEEEMAAKGRSGKWFPWDILSPCGPITITLERPGKVSGRVILAATDEPVAGAEVVFASDGESLCSGYGGHSVTQTVRTGRDGAFGFSNVSTGVARVAATAEGLVSKEVPVPVKAGKAVRDVLVELKRPSSIRGRVFDAKTERPLAGVYVQLDGEGCRSDGSGNYKIENRVPGASKLYVFSPWGLDPKRHAHVGGHSGNATEVELLPGECLEQDLYCVKQKKDERGRVVGRVLDGHGKWVPDATVRYGSSYATTDAQGRFLLENRNPGSIELSAFDEANGTYGLGKVEIVAGQEAKVDIVLSGKAASLSGHILDDKGAPVEMSGYLFLNRSGAPSRTASPNQDGEYSPGLLVPGDYWIYLDSPTGYSCEPAERRLCLEEGDVVTDADFVLTKLGGVLAGSVVTSEGKPARHVALWVHGGSKNNGGQRGQTDGDGRFRLEGVPEEEELVFRAGSLSNTTEWAQVRVEAGREDLRIVLQKPGVLRGTCPKPEGILNISAYAEGTKNGQGDIHMQLDGAFSFLLQPDTYTVTLKWETGQRKIADLVVEPGKVTDLGEISLLEGFGALTGTVTMAGGRVDLSVAKVEIHVALASVEVHPGSGRYSNMLVPSDPRWYWDDRLETPGGYHIQGVPPGVHEATAELRLPGGTSFAVSRRAEIAADSETEADFGFKLGTSSVRGTVSTPFKAGVAVGLFEKGTCPLVTGEKTQGSELSGLICYSDCQSDGSFALEHLPAGGYDIAAFQYTGVRCDRIDLQSVTLKAGEATSVQFELPK